MPNVVGVVEMNGQTNLLTVLLGDGSPVPLTRAEADAYIAQHSNFTDAQMESQFLSLVQGRWVGRSDTVAVHLLSRSPAAVTVWIGSGVVPATWWI